MVNLSTGSSQSNPTGTSDLKKGGMNRMDLRLYKKNLSPRETSELEKTMRNTLQKRMSEKRKEKLDLIGETKSKTDARKSAQRAFVEKKRQEVHTRLERVFNKTKKSGHR